MLARDLTVDRLYNIFLHYAELINPFGATIQCIHESESAATPRQFDSSLALEGNNLAGIKAFKSWKGDVLEKKTWEQKPTGEKYQTVARFKAYPSVEDFVGDYSLIISKSYVHCSIDNFMGYFSGMSKREPYGAWATDKKYFEKLLGIAWKYGGIFFPNQFEKFKAVLINAASRHLFILPEHEEMAVRFVQSKVPNQSVPL